MWELILLVGKDIQPGRLVESLIFLGVLLWRIRPHLKRVEERLAGLEKAVTDGFKSGEQRFKGIEDRVTQLEKTQGGQNGKGI